MQSVDQHAAAHVDGDVPVTVELQDVTGLKLRHRDTGQGRLIVAGARDRDAGRGPRGLGQPGAVAAWLARSAPAERVRAVAPGIADPDRLPPLGARRHGAVAADWAVPAAPP